MKIKILFSAITVMALCFLALRTYQFLQTPSSGALTKSDFVSLTNAVRKITAIPIARVNQVDVNPGRVAVSVGSASNQTDYFFEHTHIGWRYTPSTMIRR